MVLVLMVVAVTAVAAVAVTAVAVVLLAVLLAKLVFRQSCTFGFIIPDDGNCLHLLL